MNKVHTAISSSRLWLKFAAAVLGVLWILWLSGTWPTNPVVEYSPPNFEQLEISQGILSFTQRSKSSGGEIVLKLDDGKKLILSCSPPNTTVDSCLSLYRDYVGQKYGEADRYKDLYPEKRVIAWWMAEPDWPGNGHGRIYQMEIDGRLFLSYPMQVEYYVKHHRIGGDRNVFFAYFLILLTGPIIIALRKKPNL
jgi:hypothetical protein